MTKTRYESAFSVAAEESDARPLQQRVGHSYYSTLLIILWTVLVQLSTKYSLATSLSCGMELIFIFKTGFLFRFGLESERYGSVFPLGNDELKLIPEQKNKLCDE